MLDLHSEFHSHPVSRWPMTKVGVHPVLGEPKGPHPGKRNVGTGSTSLCTTDAHPALVNLINKDKMKEGSIDVQDKS